MPVFPILQHLRPHAAMHSQVEVKLDGEGPWPLPDGGSDFEIVLTPGHTEAHCCAVYKPDKVSRSTSTPQYAFFQCPSSAGADRADVCMPGSVLR